MQFLFYKLLVFNIIDNYDDLNEKRKFINYLYINMEILFKKLLKTYNTNYLDSMNIDLQEALKRESEEKQLSGAKREILRQLIENHYDESKKKPIAQFIGGPFSLTVHWLPEYQKKIYIFGEQHFEIMDCDKFKQFDSRNNVITPIEDYLYELIINTDVFIDFIFEIHTFDKSLGEYPEKYIPLENMEGRLANLYTKFQKCLQTKTRGHKDCKLSRIHYFDIRTESAGNKTKFFDIFWYKNKMETIIDNNDIDKNILKQIKEFKEKNPENDEDAGYLYYFYNKTEMAEDEIRKLWSELTLEKKNKWVKYENDKTTLGAKIRKVITQSQYIKDIFSRINNAKIYEDFWKHAIRFNKFTLKEKSRDFENIDLKERIINFIMSEMIKIANRDKKDWQEYTTFILSIITKTYTEDEDELKSFDDSLIELYVKNTISLLTEPHAILADFYTLLRIFKNFNMTDMEKAYTGATDQPSSASNIIIYAGDYHSDRYRRFLKEMGYDPIEKTGQFTNYSALKHLFIFPDDTLPKNCIDMSHISQPFFNNPS